MSLEDEFPDVIAKAMGGLEMGADELAIKAGSDQAAISGLLDGKMDEGLAKRIAPILGLDPDALIALPSYLPKHVEVAGIRRIELPFRQWTVNSWLIEIGGTRLLFDTGFGGRDILAKLSPADLDAALITHDHGDHTGGVGALKATGVEVITEVAAMAREAFTVGGIGLRAVDLSGHKSPAVGYFISGFAQPVFVAGDAIFAGSMGGCRTNAAYRLAFRTLRGAFRDIPGNTIILPGHGPATTLAQESVSNPFRMGFAGDC